MPNSTNNLRAKREIRRSFGLWLRHKREDSGLTQESAARSSNTSRNHWSQIEAGLKRPSAKKAVEIARSLGVAESEVLTRAGYSSES